MTDKIVNVPTITVLGQYVKDFSYENPHVLKNTAEKKGTPDMNVNIQVQAQQAGEQLFEVELIVHVEGKIQGDPAFMVELTYAGIFNIPHAEPEEIKKTVLIECPRLLFPFARNLIAAVTQEGGVMPPFLLNPIDFEALYKSQQEQPTTALN